MDVDANAGAHVSPFRIERVVEDEGEGEEARRRSGGGIPTAKNDSTASVCAADSSKAIRKASKPTKAETRSFGRHLQYQPPPHLTPHSKIPISVSSPPPIPPHHPRPRISQRVPQNATPSPLLPAPQPNPSPNRKPAPQDPRPTRSPPPSSPASATRTTPTATPSPSKTSGSKTKSPS